MPWQVRHQQGDMMVEFNASIQGAVSSFVEGLSTGGRRGLWVFGPRQSGTTTVARHVVDEVIASGITAGKGIKATWLERTQRQLWSTEGLLRGNPSDFPLWSEAMAAADGWEDLWVTPILWINDFYAVDTEFWRRHLLGRVDERLKDPNLVTVLAGTIPPRQFGEDWHTGFKALCQIIKLEDRAER